MRPPIAYAFRWVSLLLLLPSVLYAHLDPSKWRVVDVSSENLLTGELADHAIDGRPETQWHTQWHTTRDIPPAQPPHFITIDFGEEHRINAVRYRTRAHGEGGVPKQFSLEVSLDGDDWTEVAAGDFRFRGRMSAHAVVTLEAPRPARFLRLTILSLQPSDSAKEPGLCASEIDVATPESPLVPTTVLPVPQSREWNYGGYVWRTRHRDLLAYAAAHNPRLVFLGDSITHRWGAPPYDNTPRTGQAVWHTYYGHRNALSLGYGWDRLENMLWRLQHGELTWTDPRLVVLMAGTNNLGVDTPQDIALGVEALCDEIHRQKAQTRILLLAIFPRSDDYPNFLELHEANRLIRPLGQRDYVTFKDIGGVFLDEQGQVPREIMPDLLHPNEEGYRRWAQAIEAEVAKTLGDTPVQP